MSFVSKEKTGEGVWSVTAAVDAEAFNAALDAVFERELPKFQLPGFRKGKAPRSMLEKRCGANLFFEEALDDLLPALVEEAVTASELELQYQPQDLDIKEISKESGATLCFTVIVKPEITVGNYIGLEVPAPPVDVTEADIDARIEELRRRNARSVEVEGRAAQEGDTAQIDFEGFADGVAFEGGKSENYDLDLGSGSFIPGFEEQIVGHMPGEEFDINVSFPEEYGAENLAGKPALFKIKLHALKTEELPELDDEFAQEVGEDYDTVADLRAGIRKELEEAKAKASEDRFVRGVQDAVAALAEGEIAGEIFQRRAKRNTDLMAERLQVPLERYLQYTGQDEDEFNAMMLERAELQVRLELALEAIAAKEGLTPTEEDIEADYAELAQEHQAELAQVKFAVPREEITRGLQREMALKLVQERAVKTEAADDEADGAE
ncbi:MAG: trigger factor [Oscillospiraceae bacterium]|nr:trigger factor [Oscillospiraceae bacterium]